MIKWNVTRVALLLGALTAYAMAGGAGLKWGA